MHYRVVGIAGFPVGECLLSWSFVAHDLKAMDHPDWKASDTAAVTSLNNTKMHGGLAAKSHK